MSQKKIAAKLLIVLLICLAPMIGALFLYQARDGLHFVTKNTGTLLQPPVPASELGLLDAQGHPVDIQSFGLRWWLVLYTPDVCDIKCTEVVAYFNTIHLSLTEHQHRLGEFVITSNALNTAKLPKLSTLHVAKITKPLPESLPLHQGYGLWIMDPNGNIILSYDPSTLDNRPLLDLRHLLKVSRIG
jgi:hypothetical protein